MKQKSKISKILEEKKGFLKNSVRADFLSAKTLGFVGCFFDFWAFDFIGQMFPVGSGTRQAQSTFASFPFCFLISYLRSMV